MPIFTSSYLLPAILLNPAFVLHLINTFASYMVPPLPTFSDSPHPIMEALGPLPGSTLYLDMHADDRLCWGYTGLMVVLQMLAIGRVQDTRDRRRAARTARLEKDTKNKEIDKIARERRALGLDGADDTSRRSLKCANDRQERSSTGLREDSGLESDESVTETSEEEMML